MAEPSTIVFDEERARTRLGGDHQLLREMITIFRADSPRLMTAIQKAAARGDLEALRRPAHTLKGSLGTIDAPRAFEAAQHLEALARGTEVGAIAPAVKQLEREMTELARVLAPAPRRRSRRANRAEMGRRGSRRAARAGTRRRPS